MLHFSFFKRLQGRDKLCQKCRRKIAERVLKVNKIRVTLTISLKLWTFVQHIDSHNIQSWKTIRTPQLHIGINTRENCWRSLIFAEISVAVMHNRVEIVRHIPRILLIFSKLRFFPCKSKIEHFFRCRCAKWTKDVSLVRVIKVSPSPQNEPVFY